MCSESVERTDIFSIDAASPWVLCAVLGSTIEEGYKNTRKCPNEGNKDGERTRGHDYEERLRSLALFCLEQRRLKDAFMAVYSFLMRGSGEGGADLFSLVCGGRMPGNGLKLEFQIGY